MGGPTPAAMGFAEVAVDSPTAPGRTFSYSIPDGLRLVPGHLVRVPFGRRTLGGLVMSLAELPQVAETRPILSITGDGPVLTEVQLRLARWVSDYYVSPCSNQPRQCCLRDSVSASGLVSPSEPQWLRNSRVCRHCRPRSQTTYDGTAVSISSGLCGRWEREHGHLRLDWSTRACWNGRRAGALPEPAPSSWNTQGCPRLAVRRSGTGSRIMGLARRSRPAFSGSSQRAESLCCSGTPEDGTAQGR